MEKELLILIENLNMSKKRLICLFLCILAVLSSIPIMSMYFATAQTTEIGILNGGDIESETFWKSRKGRTADVDAFEGEYVVSANSSGCISEKFTLENEREYTVGFWYKNPQLDEIDSLNLVNAKLTFFIDKKQLLSFTGLKCYIYELAKKSIDINKLNEQIDLINDDAMNLMNKYETDTFDIITCNPPYFKNIEKSTKNLDMHKTIARHEIYIDLSKICQLSRKLLKNNGKLALIYPELSNQGTIEYPLYPFLSFLHHNYFQDRQAPYYLYPHHLKYVKIKTLADKPVFLLFLLLNTDFLSKVKHFFLLGLNFV